MRQQPGRQGPASKGGQSAAKGNACPERTAGALSNLSSSRD